MEFAKLGNSEYKVSRVGLGCWQLGAEWGDPVSDQTAHDILQAAVDGGINFLDTADIYGGGRSEGFIGEFTKHHRDRLYIATKHGRHASVYPDGYSLDALRQGVEGSLQRLGVDSLDLLQLHCIPRDVMAQGTIWDALRQLQSEGLISHFGASVETVEEGLLCLEQEGITSLQVIYNIFRQQLAEELLPQAEAQGVGIIVRLPLASGLLSGKFSATSQFAENDHRHFNRDGQAFNVGETFAGLPFEKGLELVEEIRQHVPEGVPMAQFALRWLLDQPAVTAVIPGASKPSQASSNAQAASLDPLPKATHAALQQLYATKVAQHIRGPY